MNSGANTKVVFRQFWGENLAPDESKQFVEESVQGVRQNVAQIDEMIQKCTEHWDLARMAAVDRNVMRMAVYEMLFRLDIPAIVSINEAVDLAKYFSSRESGKFVNGILDRIRKTVRPDESKVT